MQNFVVLERETSGTPRPCYVGAAHSALHACKAADRARRVPERDFAACAVNAAARVYAVYFASDAVMATFERADLLNDEIAEMLADAVEGDFLQSFKVA